MSCAQIHDRLEAYVDGRVAAEDRLAIRDHLAWCASCRAEAELVGEVEERMREAFLSETPSASLQQRVDAIATTERKRGTPHKRFARDWQGALAAAVVLVAVLGAALTGLGLYPPGTSQAGVMTASIEELRTFIESRRSFDIVSRDPLVVQRWFQGKLDFMPPTPPALADLDLVGGRLCFFLDRRIAAYMYVAEGRVISLYIMQEARLSRPGGEKVRLGGRQIVVGELAGFHGAFWRSGDLAFALIADLPRDQLLDLAEPLSKVL